MLKAFLELIDLTVIADMTSGNKATTHPRAKYSRMVSIDSRLEPAPIGMTLKNTEEPGEIPFVANWAIHHKFNRTS